MVCPKCSIPMTGPNDYFPNHALNDIMRRRKQKKVSKIHVNENRQDILILGCTKTKYNTVKILFRGLLIKLSVRPE